MHFHLHMQRQGRTNAVTENLFVQVRHICTSGHWRKSDRLCGFLASKCNIKLAWKKDSPYFLVGCSMAPVLRKLKYTLCHSAHSRFFSHGSIRTSTLVKGSTVLTFSHCSATAKRIKRHSLKLFVPQEAATRKPGQKSWSRLLIHKWDTC